VAGHSLSTLCARGIWCEEQARSIQYYHVLTLSCETEDKTHAVRFEAVGPGRGTGRRQTCKPSRVQQNLIHMSSEVTKPVPYGRGGPTTTKTMLGKYLLCPCAEEIMPRNLLILHPSVSVSLTVGYHGTTYTYDHLGTTRMAAEGCWPLCVASCNSSLLY
jgi:hypothetical protein